MRILKLVFLGISLGIIAFAIVPRASKLPGQIAGTVANPLLIDNKFCSNPASPDQTGCTNFISSALAQTMSSPYQNVSGNVRISNTGSGDIEVARFTGVGGNSYITLDGNPGGYVLFDDTNDFMRIGTHGSSNGLFVKGNNVGIGTAGPATRLELYEGGAVNHPLLRWHYPGVAEYIGGILSNGTFLLENTNGGPGAFGGTPLGISITTNGNVGIGTADPGIAKTYVSNSGTDVGLYVGNGTPFGQAKIEVDGPPASHIWVAENKNRVFSITSGGVGYLQASAWTYGSDKRMKENIAPVGSGLDKIMQLNPVSFDYINGVKNNLGFIAQDIQPVIPEAVSVIDTKTGMLGLKTDFIIPYLVKGMQEQQKQISSFLGIIDAINKIGRFIQIETQKLIVSGVDILERLNSLSQKVEAQQKEIDLLKQEMETLKAR